MNEEKKPYEELTRLWEEFGDTPIDNEDRILENFQEWEAGTNRFDIWHWFDEQFPGGLGKFLQGDKEDKPMKDNPVFITVLRKDGYFWTIMCDAGGEELGIWLRDHFSSQEKADWIVKHGDARNIKAYNKIGKWKERLSSGKSVDHSGLAVGAPDFLYEESNDADASLFYCNCSAYDWEEIAPEILPSLSPVLDWGRSHSHLIWDGAKWAINRVYEESGEADPVGLPSIRTSEDIKNLEDLSSSRQGSVDKNNRKGFK